MKITKQILSKLTVCLIAFALSNSLQAARFSGVHHQDWQEWSFDYQVSGDFDGLSLTNVKYQGVDILNKASLPVMRVFYDNDVCGPYADRMGGNLTPISWANNNVLVLREFTQSGRQWLELGIQDTIGDYVIYQSWYLSADGVLDGHIFSKGLQCNVDHVHYPYWRMDFDLAGDQNDQIRRLVNGNWQTISTESNERVTTADNHRWQVRDTATGDSVEIEFGAAGWDNINGTVDPQDSFNNNRIFGRRYKSSEDEGWRYGPHPEVPHDNNENINSQDIVLWYKGYLPHDASEGPSLWHSTGVRFIVNLAGSNPQNNQPTISPVGNRTNQVGETISLQINANDSDGDTLSYSASGLPAGLNINSNSGIISGTLTSDGVSNTNVTVNDGNGGSAQVNFNWTVTTPPGGGTSNLSIPISLDTDDAEEKSSGRVIIRSLDLDLVASGGNQTVGMRFNGINIPQGSAIVSAYIQFTTASPRSSATSLTLRGQATDNASTFVNTISNNVSTRPTTTASAQWSPVPWTSIGEASNAQRTPDLSSIVQEIVNRSGWARNHSLALIITGTGKRDASSFDGNQSQAPVLHIEYADNGGTANSAPTVSIASPASGGNFNPGDNISFSATSSDAEDGNLTSQLNWSSNLDGVIGNGGSFTTSSLSEGTHTITASVFDSGGLSGSDSVTISIGTSGGQTTLSIPITASLDDVEEKSSGNVIIGSRDLDLVASGGNQTVGMRFNGINIPQGSTIVNAYIQFTTTANIRDSLNPASLILKGEATNNASGFARINNNLSTRQTTSASVPWSPAPWTVIGEAGVNQRTPDIKSIIQEIVNRTGWSSNNSLAFFVAGTGKRDAVSFDGNASNAPVLHLEFSPSEHLISRKLH